MGFWGFGAGCGLGCSLTGAGWAVGAERGLVEGDFPTGGGG